MELSTNSLTEANGTPGRKASSIPEMSTRLNWPRMHLNSTLKAYSRLTCNFNYVSLHMFNAHSSSDKYNIRTAGDMGSGLGLSVNTNAKVDFNVDANMEVDKDTDVRQLKLSVEGVLSEDKAFER
eukprot:747508-Amorphochlora_amoeboformis.AAC.1